jgi:hypothetical protein
MNRFNISVTEERYDEIVAAQDAKRDSQARIVAFVIGVFVIYYIFDIGFIYDAAVWVSNWRTLDAPYKYAVAVIYYLIIVPYSYLLLLWQLELTSYKNINFIILLVSSFFYIGLWGSILMLSRIPLVFIGTWSFIYFIGAWAYSWVFST